MVIGVLKLTLFIPENHSLKGKRSVLRKIKARVTNTFNVCEFKTGGRWSLIMHGPNGHNYPNENVFAEIESPRKVIVQHASEPKYRLTITLASSAVGTVVSWLQAFESSEVASRLEHIVVPANEQNLERLSVEVLRKLGGG